MKIVKDQIIFDSRYWQKLLGSFGFMALILFLSFIFFDNLKRANMLIIILANLLAGGSVVGFFITLFSLIRRLEFHEGGIRVHQLLGLKQYDWAHLKNIQAYQNEQKQVLMEFWFQDQSLKLVPENLGAQNNRNLLEGRKIMRDLLKVLTQRKWINTESVNDRLDWVSAEIKAQLEPHFKTAEIVGEVQVTQHNAVVRNGREEIVSATRYTSSVTKLVIEEGYSDLGRKVTSYGVFFSEKLTGSTYYYDFGVEQYDAVGQKVIFYNICNHKDKMRLDLPTLRLEKIR